ncbi:hypothetical protein MKW98_029948 [Papaver atlanticum]|uniref:Uncharacterized protein n=1 Tax=Papaver atlanticum TaxID=357466 RepID=A0AAD4TL82_9MAGN|nr:hypothetical protein MKW98_029948 [Papaver atlanticum]
MIIIDHSIISLTHHQRYFEVVYECEDGNIVSGSSHPSGDEIVCFTTAGGCKVCNFHKTCCVKASMPTMPHKVAGQFGFLQGVGSLNGFEFPIHVPKALCLWKETLKVFSRCRVSKIYLW